MGKKKVEEVKTNPFDEAIVALFEERKKYAFGTDERKKIDAEICRLAEAKGKARDEQKQPVVKDNKWIGPLIGGLFGLAQVLVVTHYEELHCLTSKAVGFISKPKL